ncbi:MAG: transketolase C-terminal domain-containing protein [Brevundimonas sp.]|uniref:transketolase family protein n=1 Tax=Brevundimonas sp. TaxID=1871086 RepID=UPI002617BB1F|nr:transketolase C-terminal domain-containing protein [Brevundimonas sp.]MDI6623126.1 transketolase C-terminal domain-containing protein [Brevundimonas sp.]MDQ7813023.1 transketolase C-terminal domain-containing protein [Brevundimonas sp.]
MRDAFIQALTELAAVDDRIVLVTGDLGFGVLQDFASRFPQRYINAGVAEQNMTAIACGMALEGFQVYTYSIGNFPTLRCLEQIRNDVCYHDADVKIVSVGGGFSYGQLGMSHFATEDLAIMRALPNMTVVAPSDPWEAAELTRQVSARRGPTYLRLDKSAAGLPPTPATLGRSRQVRDGEDVCLIATGGILEEAVKAADLLAAQGISAAVHAVATVKPLDPDLVATAGAAKAVVVVEEHTVIGGLGGAIAEACMSAGAAPRRFLRIGLEDIYPTVVGDQRYLRKVYELDAEAIARRTRALLTA